MQVKTLNSRCDFQRTAQAEVDAAKEQEMTSIGPVSFPMFLEEESSVDLRQNAWKAWLHGDVLTRLVYLPAGGREFINPVCRLADTGDEAWKRVKENKNLQGQTVLYLPASFFSAEHSLIWLPYSTNW